MNNKNFSLYNSYPSIDLRSPKEYKKGTIPSSVNLPILNDAEFHEIGKTFLDQKEGKLLLILETNLFLVKKKQIGLILGLNLF